jgi:hypothetical protein
MKVKEVIKDNRIKRIFENEENSKDEDKETDAGAV